MIQQIQLVEQNIADILVVLTNRKQRFVQFFECQFCSQLFDYSILNYVQRIKDNQVDEQQYSKKELQMLDLLDGLLL